MKKTIFRKGQIIDQHVVRELKDPIEDYESLPNRALKIALLLGKIILTGLYIVYTTIKHTFWRSKK